jgi:hypothetical protein
MAEKKNTEPKTVTLQDAQGNDVEVPVGLDGQSPVSPNNPHPKATNYQSESYSATANKPDVKLQDGPRQAVEANRANVGDEYLQTEDAAKTAKTAEKNGTSTQVETAR